MSSRRKPGRAPRRPLSPFWMSRWTPRWTFALAALLALAAAPLPSGASGASGSGTSAPPEPPPPAAGAAPGAPPPSPTSGETFGEAIEVTVVNVDVVVRDGAGRQVSGLGRNDFSLSIDGRKVEISNFSSQSGGAAPPSLPPSTATAAAADATRSGPAAPATPATSDQAPARERLSLVVVVDNANMRPFDRNRLLKQLRAFLQKTVQPGDQVLLVTHDPGLRVRHAFHDSAETLLPALDKLEKEAASGLNRDLELRQVMDELQDIVKQQGCNAGIGEAAGLARTHQEQVMADVKVTYGSLHNLLRSLDGVEGRKALVYVGDGLATQVGTDVFGELEELCPGNASHTNFQVLDALAPMRQVIADANASRVTFYTLEATGLPAYASAEHAGRPPISFELARRIDQDRQDSLTSLARETGGRAALNGTDFRHDLDEIAAEISTSYSLGFTPPPGTPGRTHSIRVELSRPGLRATYRTSYRDRTAAERLEGAVEAALIYGQVDNPLGAEVKVAGGTAGEHNRVTVPLSLRVPFGKLTFVPREDGRHGHVTIFVGNMDSRGGLAAIQRIQVPLRIPEADAKRVLASRMGYDLKLVVEPGRQRIALAVRDDVARVASSVIAEIEVDKSGAATAVGATPAVGAATARPGAP